MHQVKRRALATACAAALASPAGPVAAQQDAAEPRGVLKVEVTGSHILRSDVESALPVQVITREDIERSGSTTVAELMSKVSANVLAWNDAMSIGSQGLTLFPRPGLSSVNLRGIGDGSTLVLINGRRVANYAFDGGAVDVNSIPVAAIDRVEILKDGASAIYGTDAIAGVVNFILRKDFTGIQVTGYGAWTEQGGGNQYQGIVSAGFGDLAKDKYNVFVSLNYQKDEALRAADREFTRTGYLPEEGVFLVSAQSFPANISLGRGRIGSPNFASGCAPPTSIAATINGNEACYYDTGSLTDIIPAVERTSVLGRATFQLNPDLQLFAEAGYANNDFKMTAPPNPVWQGFTFGMEPVIYPAGGPYYPTEFASANGLTGNLNLRYRTEPLGNRVNDVETQALRAVVGIDGSGAGWDYGAAALYSENRQTDNYADGYVSQSRLLSALATGLINPFGPSGPAGDALLASTEVYGDFHSAKGSTWLIDAKASREVLRLPGGPLAIALGGEWRREALENTFASEVTSGDVIGARADHQSVSGSRSVWALYAEASVPFAKGFESQLAVRYDNYSDFGSTVNPKVALRWQPVKSVLLRTSWGTGFRAPTLYDLYTPLQHGFTSSLYADPIRCPVTDLPYDCFGEYPAVFGGNPNLQPETSEQFNAGVVWEPVPGLSLTLDYWKINKSNVVSGLPEQAVLAPGSPWESTNVIRGPVDPAYPTLPGPIETVVLWNENLGSLRTSGFDIGIDWRGPATAIGRFAFSLNGTYVDTWTIQFLDEPPYPLVGNNDGGAIPRWRHYASLNWSLGPWSATLAQAHQSGYSEIDERYCDESGCARRRVGSYSLWDLQGQYTGFRNTTLVAGIKNLLDSAPPFTLWPSGFGNNIDQFYVDPRGRTFYAKLTYTFK